MVLLLFLTYDNSFRFKWTGLLVHYFNRFSFYIFHSHIIGMLQRITYNNPLRDILVTILSKLMTTNLYYESFYVL